MRLLSVRVRTCVRTKCGNTSGIFPIQRVERGSHEPKTNNMLEFKKYLLKLGLAGLTSPALVEKGRNNVIMLQGNVTFPTLASLLPPLATACDELEAANLEVVWNGGKAAYTNKREKEYVVRSLITALGQQVQVISGGDRAKIESAGFEVRKTAEPITALAQPQDLKSHLTGFTGMVALDWKVVRGAHYYQVWMTDGDPNKGNWVLLGSSTKSRFTAENLVPGTVYTFRVNAVGTRAVSIYSDITSLMAA